MGWISVASMKGMSLPPPPDHRPLLGGVFLVAFHVIWGLLLTCSIVWETRATAWMAKQENTPVLRKEQHQFDDEAFIEYDSDSDCCTEYGSVDDDSDDEAGDMFYMYIVDESDDEITTDDEEMFETEPGNLSGDEVEIDRFLGVEV